MVYVTMKENGLESFEKLTSLLTGTLITSLLCFLVAA